MSKRTIAVSFLGTQLDYGGKPKTRWNRWRPNIGLCSQPDLVVDQLHLIYAPRSQRLADTIVEDIGNISAETTVIRECFDIVDPWDFEEVYATLFDWCKRQSFDTQNNHYLFHITTGTHVVQICSYLLTESGHFPGRLIQTSPGNKNKVGLAGQYQIIDLDLSKYDQLANRFAVEHREGEEILKNGIATQNPQFNQLISEIEKVAIRSPEPILLTGPTGAGKSQLAARIYQLKKHRSTIQGALVSVNCATLKGENAMAALFGHTKGAFTGAQTARAGYLLSADKGMLFLDEIAELGMEEQAMLLHAIEHKQFYPVGSDQRVTSDFQLIAGTNQHLQQLVQTGQFREDLLARINLWTYALPPLKKRLEDIPANIEFELGRYTQKTGQRVQFNKEALQRFVDFAQSPDAHWRGNFRDLSAAITRLCTLADASRISVQDVASEIQRLQQSWLREPEGLNLLPDYLSQAQLETLDEFDQHQLNHVLDVCENHKSMAAAGRSLFNVSRQQKSSCNDSSRLQKYLGKFNLKWQDIQH